ncbi:MAG: T9SS type A sorting domain-containing protein, partial [Rhodothermaceae bacterium]|nr:T9SS type A sorting domain-containing protein [Rhodothermaceae bacterium]
SLEGRSDIGRTLAKDLTGRIYAGGNEGLYRSDERGDNFVLILEVDSGVEKVLVQDDRKYLILTKNEGILRSVDEGASWGTLNEGLPGDTELLTGIFDDLTLVDGLNAYVSVKGAGIYQGINIIQLSNDGSNTANAFNTTAYPNPFSEKVNIRLHLDRTEHVSIEIFDVLGRNVATLHDAPIQSGQSTLEWDTVGLPLGIYFVRVQGITHREVRAIVKSR